MSQWQDLLELESAQNDWVCAGACTTRGRRASNEDAHVLRCDWRVGSPPAALFAVMDGHGGCDVSSFVRRRVAETLHIEINQPGCWFSQASRRQAVESAFVALDHALGYSVGKAVASDCGSTCTIAAVWPEPRGGPSGRGCDYRLMLGNLGDSRGIVVRLGRLVGETEDHKPDLPSEAQRIRDAGGVVITPQRCAGPARIDNDLACARSLGDWRFKASKHRGPGEQKVSSIPDVFEFECQRGDIVVLACDGVFDVLRSGEVAELVHNATENAEGVLYCDTVAIASAVALESLERGTTDNVSCVVMRLLDPPVVGDVDWRPLVSKSSRLTSKGPTAGNDKAGKADEQKVPKSLGRPKSVERSAQPSTRESVKNRQRQGSVQEAPEAPFCCADECSPFVPPASVRPQNLLLRPLRSP
eukprot:TRINITY_DN19015_c0_g1_i1.p1 TRINITY_DN19015_c0_g1~~TRINITY_DN19015_c0_g1_i1.p1  ORF type:complete len:437 (-),score=46.72 TRINITY_DN19015_c0_g1_i1:356-1600(-)